MLQPTSVRRAIAMAGLVIAAAIECATAHASPPAPRALPSWPLPGWSLYERLCLACHGARGDGRGPAAIYASDPPRDFTRGAFAWRTTPFGAPPTDGDLREIIRFGAPGTSMPAFPIADAEVDQLVAIVRAFSSGTAGKPVAPLTLGDGGAENAARGAALWTQLGCDRCHGADGRGDGPAAAGLAPKPYDLTSLPLRRPRDRDAATDRRRAAAWSIATGMTGTAMPGYAGQVPAADLWALADRVVQLGAAAGAPHMPQPLAADRVASDRTPTAVWPGDGPNGPDGSDDDAAMFGAALAPQGAPPASLAPAEASLSSAQCGRCHAKQLREWQSSLHAQSASSGLAARLADGANATACRRCHAPLAEQAGDPALYAEGATCAGCHVRGWTRRGPPGVAPSLQTLPDYPFAPSTLYERADFCLPCHQLPPRTAVAGKPLLDTYREWLAGPYMPRGIECQSCHMPNREHQWLGVHDPATFRQGIRLTATATATGAGVAVTADLTNIGAGHDLPTTPTPAVWLRVELVDAAGHVVQTSARRIGRDIYWDAAAQTWHERADTRIPPGETLHVVETWPRGAAASARVTVEVHPDDYYEGLYAARLAQPLAPPVHALYTAALRRAQASHYVAETRALPLP